jgi:tetratricopeptide (TPR) repeat protein
MIGYATRYTVFLLLGLLLPVLCLAEESASSFQQRIQEGDQHWDLRAEGSQGSRADPKEIDQAISAYWQALLIDPESLAARWRLMRVLYFKAEYTPNSNDEKKKLFEEGKGIGEEALQRIRQNAARRIGKSVGKASPVELATLLKGSENVVECFFWSSANWGGWSLAFGKLQAAREGAATKIRDLAAAVILMDPNYAEGGGYRVLGRLHHQTPAIPFITGWASTKEAVVLLRHAAEIGPRHPLNRLYLAEALWDLNRDNHEEALKIIQALENDQPRAQFLVEDKAVQERAQSLWMSWNKK